MRSILLVFCISFPFTIIGRVGAISLMLMQSALSFSASDFSEFEWIPWRQGLLGIEFVSRQMEHPFSNDEADIPLRRSLLREF